MKTLATNLYASVLCEASMVEDTTETGNSNGFRTPPPEHCGYSLINDHLVPEIFIQRVIDHVDGRAFEYDCTLGKEDIFSAEFLATLDVQEHAVLMLVLLEVIARGDFEVNLWAAYEQHPECDAVAA